MKQEICNFFPQESNIMESLEAKLEKCISLALEENPLNWKKKPLAAKAIRLSRECDTSESKY